MEILDRIEESGLDKLIKLLTEHCRKHYGFKDYDDIEIDTDSVNFYLYHNGKRCFPIGVEKVICKDFGFIQWLAKHFMLNVTKIDARIALLDFNVTDRMLMALAISEDTIALLVDCLKTKGTEQIE